MYLKISTRKIPSFELNLILILATHEEVEDVTKGRELRYYQDPSRGFDLMVRR